MPRTVIHATRNLVQGDIYLVEWEGRIVVVKDITSRNWFLRVLLGRWGMAREWQALCWAREVPGIPHPVARAGPDAFLMERLPGIVMNDPAAPKPSPEFFDHLAALMNELHACGVAHGDLRRQNIMIDDQLQPHVLDFATAIIAQPAWWGGAHRLAHRAARRIDQIKVAKLKASYHPGTLTAAQQDLLENPPWYLALGRFLRHRVYSSLKPSRWRKNG